MPDLIIDNRPIRVPAGTRVIDAAEKLGIMVPRFCYLKVLGAVGACRMCAVHFVEGPVKGVEMSCMVEARDGMVVSTTDAEAVEFRRQVIEWLMVNHPHDCPVCDEGGQCLLQDETVSGGHGIRRYPGRKRTHRDQYLGPFIQQEMNRCIHCYRCSRFYKEYSGYRDFGVLQIGNRIFYGRFADGCLESPFAGNLVDICPTGVFTDKPARYRARRWDMQRVPSICPHCSLGCSTTANSFHREIIRQEARENSLVNGSFICDRGRFGCFYANRADRPWRPRVDEKEVDWDRVLEETAAKMQKIIAGSGPQAVAFLGSARLSMETIAVLQDACTKLACRAPLFFTDPGQEYKTRRAAARLDPQLAVSLAEIEEADCILVLGVDPVNEAPMLALALRQAVRRGASVAVLDPRPVSLPFAFSRLAAAPAELPSVCAMLVCQAFAREDLDNLDGKDRDFYEKLAAVPAPGQVPGDMIDCAAADLKTCKQPLIVCGTVLVDETCPDFAADLARLLHRIKGQCGLFYTLAGPNAFGAAVLGQGTEGWDFPGLLDAVEQGSIKALVTVEADPFHDFCDRPRLEKALAGLELLACLDYLPSELSRRSRILCPAATHFETPSTFVNQEGRLQQAEPVHNSGRPLSLITEGRHPERDYASHNDRFDPRPSRKILAELIGRLTGESQAGNVEPDSSGQAVGNLIRSQFEQSGCQVDNKRLRSNSSGTGYRYTFSDRPPSSGNRNEPELILTDLTFGTEELSSSSAAVDEVKPAPWIMMHEADASEAGLENGAAVILHLDRGSLPVRLHTSEKIARGCAILPRLAGLYWQQFEYRRGKAPRCRIAKA